MEAAPTLSARKRKLFSGGMSAVSGSSSSIGTADRIAYAPKLSSTDASRGGGQLRDPYIPQYENSRSGASSSDRRSSRDPSPLSIPTICKMRRCCPPLKPMDSSSTTCSNRLSLLSSTTHAVHPELSCSRSRVVSEDCVVFPSALKTDPLCDQAEEASCNIQIQRAVLDVHSQCSDTSTLCESTVLRGLEVSSCQDPQANPLVRSPNDAILVGEADRSMLCSLTSDDSTIVDFAANDSLRIGSPQLITWPSDYRYVSGTESGSSAQPPGMLTATGDGRISSSGASTYSPVLATARHAVLHSPENGAVPHLARQPSNSSTGSRRASLRKWFGAHLSINAPSSSEESSDCKASYQYRPNPERRQSSRGSFLNLSIRSSSSGNRSWYHSSLLSQLGKPRRAVHISALKPVGRRRPPSPKEQPCPSPVIPGIQLEQYDHSPKRVGSFSIHPASLSAGERVSATVVVNRLPAASECCNGVIPLGAKGTVEGLLKATMLFEGASCPHLPSTPVEAHAASVMARQSPCFVACRANTPLVEVPSPNQPVAQHTAIPDDLNSLPGADDFIAMPNVRNPRSFSSKPLIVSVITPNNSPNHNDIYPQVHELAEGVTTTDYNASLSSSSSDVSLSEGAIGPTAPLPSTRRVNTDGKSNRTPSISSMTSAMSTESHPSAWSRAQRRLSSARHHRRPPASQRRARSQRGTSHHVEVHRCWVELSSPLLVCCVMILACCCLPASDEKTVFFWLSVVGLSLLRCKWTCLLLEPDLVVVGPICRILCPTIHAPASIAWLAVLPSESLSSRWTWRHEAVCALWVGHARNRILRVIARPRMKGGTLLRHIFQHFLHQFSPPVWRQCWPSLSCTTVDEGSLANECMPCTHGHRLPRGYVLCVYV